MNRILLLLFIFPLATLAQESIDLSNLQELQSKLPDYQWADLLDEAPVYDAPREHRQEFISRNLIKTSPTRKISIRKGAPLFRFSDEKMVYLPQNIIAIAHIVVDEADYLYLLDEKNYISYKVPLNWTSPLGDVVKVYEPPKMYREFVKQKNTEFDEKPLSFYPEILLATGLTQANFTEDLLDDSRTKTTFYNRFGVAGFINIKNKAQPGLTIQYERSLHYMKGANRAQFSSLSIGPILKTPTFNQDDFPWQVVFQLRIAPHSTLSTDTTPSSRTIMNVTAAQLSFEHPTKNQWGEFIIGIGFQRQWFNLRRQQGFVRLDTRNTNNDQYGLTFSQTFR